MSDSRAAIFGRISKALGHDTSVDAPVVVQRLHERPRGPQPRWTGTPTERFLAKLAKVSATHAEVASPTGIVQAVQDYLAAQNLPPHLVAAPHPLLNELAWPEGWQVARRRAQGDDRVGLAVAFCAIAETGSLMLLAGPDSPTTLNFLPDDFLCLLPESRIVPRMEDAWDLLRAGRGALPRSTNIVTGPSRTADVEQTIQLGAHGPRRLHVLLLKD
ncbi:MAG: LUD domain-containing protein [Hydrogenophilaceae bacterium]|nr:LUD domain-containing protein [Hydrogenophilaceae bacterium]